MGHGKMLLNDYKFKFLLIGQVKVAEYICRPQKQGFQKTMTMCFHAGNVMEDDHQDSQTFLHLIHDVHDYMHRLEMQHKKAVLFKICTFYVVSV